MKNKHFECVNCEAVFRIGHDLDTNYYQIQHCPFCGDSLDEDQNYDIEDPEE